MQKQIKALCYGWILSLIIIVLFSSVLALAIQFMGLKETSLSWLSITAGCIALLIGGITAGAKGKSKGWLIGLMTGLLFSTSVLLMQFLGLDSSLSTNQIIVHLLYILVAIIGGVIGVNLTSDEES